MTFVVIGGGPTGVELAGSLEELRHLILPLDHPELDFKKMQIHLVDMEPRLLRTMSLEASRSVEQFLAARGVNVWLGAKVLSYDGARVTLSNGKVIESGNVIWAAGVVGALIPGLRPEDEVGGRIKVDEYLRAIGRKNIYALGDVAAVITEQTPRGYPMLAPVAIQQAKLMTANFRKIFARSPQLKPFRYYDLGVMATVGRHHAVADLFFGKFQGIVAWFMWAILHLMSLVGFRNKVVAMVTWIWGYFRYDRGLRLIIRSKCSSKSS